MCLLSCGACISQIILFALNFLLSLVSLAVTGIGILVLIQVKRVNASDLGDTDVGVIVAIVVGAVFTAIFFFGCCGAFCRNKCLLTTYSVFTILVATATVVLTVFAFKGLDQIKDSAEEKLTNLFSDPQNKETLNLIEATLGCCGTNGPQYYNSSIPVSCCPSSLTNLQQLQNLQQDSINVTGLTNSTSGSLLSCSPAEANERGCVDVFMELLAKILKISGHILIWVAVIEYVAAFLAMFLACYVGKS